MANSTVAVALPSSAVDVSAQRGGEEVVDHIADEWRELCAHAGNDQPFFHPEWIRAYLRAFLPGARVLVITARIDGRLQLVLPLVEYKGTFSKIPVRKLVAPVNHAAGRFDAVCSAGPHGEAAISATWNYLKNLAGWDLVQFRYALEGSALGRMADAARADGFAVLQSPDKPSPYLAIPADAELLKKLPINDRLRRELRQVRRQLAGQGALTFYRVDTADKTALDLFFQLEASGWKGREGTDVQSKGLRAFFDEIAESAARFGYLSLYMLELNGQLLAAHFGFTHQACYYAAVIAYNEDFRRFSPGHLIISEIAQDCAARGIRIFDITGQDQWWKLKWTAVSRAVSHYCLFKGPMGKLAYEVECGVKPAVERILRSIRKSA